MVGVLRETLVPAREDERGAVLALVAVFLFVLIMVAALAVDISALERQGQTLQNTADAAALAAVATWQETGDPSLAEATARDVIGQNGVDAPDIEIEVAFPTDYRLEVVISDTEPDVFLGSFAGFDGVLVRSAAAQLVRCDPGCNRTVELPTPFQPTSVVGSGDGYYPLAVGNRFYAINHDGDEIACVDRATSSQCWSGKLALPYAGAKTGPVSHASVVGTRIYWAAQQSDELTMFCWETRTESPCSNATIANLERADALGEKFLQRGGGLIAVGSRIFAFADDHTVHCIEAGTMARCPGYLGGRSTGLGEAGFAPLDPDLGVSGSNIDRILDEETGRIYHTLHITETASSAPVYDTGIHLDCWDTTTDSVCSGFSNFKLHDVSVRQAGRLFFHRTGDGVPDGVCSTGAGDISCVDFDGDHDPGLESNLSSLESALPAASAYTNGMGVHTYHAESNRLLLTSPRQLSTIHCWDFSSSTYCGSLYGFANGSETQDYGFVAEGNCLFGVGHTSVFWAFTSDLDLGCPGATIETEIDKCLCGSKPRWGRVDFDFDLSPSSAFLVLNAQVLSPDGEVLLPTDGGWVQMVGRSSSSLDLESISTDYDYLRLRVYAETDGTDPWLGPVKPAVIFDFTDAPQLIG